MATKKELIAQEVARVVRAGKPVSLETVDFNDPDRPKTCLEVDFPILPVNQVAIIEGNAGKPIYQMSKWWARRRSSVFRAMLIAAATRAPSDASHAAKLIWDSYYANHQKKGAFKNLKVADIFMGGGTTLVEGSRLGMQMVGNDLNPVAWFVVKQELADVDLDEVKRLLADIEAEVRPQIMPYYYCDGPNGEKGTWTDTRTGKVMGPTSTHWPSPGMSANTTVTKARRSSTPSGPSTALVPSRLRSSHAYHDQPGDRGENHQRQALVAHLQPVWRVLRCGGRRGTHGAGCAPLCRPG